MAHVISPIARTPRTDGGWFTEQDVLRRIEQGLPDTYTLLHGIEWAGVHDDKEHHGELDLVLVNAAGDVLLIEVKGGDVEFSGDGIYKTYGQERRAVHAQVRLQYNAMRARLADAGLPVRVNTLLVLPHAHVTMAVAQWPRERMVDAGEYDDLAHHVKRALPTAAADDARRDQVVTFFSNLLQLEPDVGARLLQPGLGRPHGAPAAGADTGRDFSRTRRAPVPPAARCA